jgi:hypothetical protein
VVKAEADGVLTLALPDGGAANLPLAEVESRRPEPLSPMPAGLADALPPARFADLIA